MEKYKFVIAIGVLILVIMFFDAFDISNKWQFLPIEDSSSYISAIITGLITFAAMQFINDENKELWKNDIFIKEQAQTIIDLRNRFYNWSELIRPFSVKLLLSNSFNEKPDALAKSHAEKTEELESFIKNNKAVIINIFDEGFYNQLYHILNGIFHYLNYTIQDPLSLADNIQSQDTYIVPQEGRDTIIDEFYQLLIQLIGKYSETTKFGDKKVHYKELESNLNNLSQSKNYDIQSINEAFKILEEEIINEKNKKLTEEITPKI